MYTHITCIYDFTIINHVWKTASYSSIWIQELHQRKERRQVRSARLQLLSAAYAILKCLIQNPKHNIVYYVDGFHSFWYWLITLLHYNWLLLMTWLITPNTYSYLSCTWSAYRHFFNICQYIYIDLWLCMHFCKRLATSSFSIQFTSDFTPTSSVVHYGSHDFTPDSQLVQIWWFHIPISQNMSLLHKPAS